MKGNKAKRIEDIRGCVRRGKHGGTGEALKKERGMIPV